MFSNWKFKEFENEITSSQNFQGLLSFMKDNQINPSNDVLKEIEGAIKRKESLDSINDSKIVPRRNDINVADFDNIQKQEDHNKIGELQK